VKALERRSDRFSAAGKVATVDTTDSLIGFQNEIKLLSMCDHPNITKFIESFFFESEMWIIIEKATGGSMSSVLDKREKGLAEPEVAACAYQLLDAVAYLHSLKIIHRDINAANTLINTDGLIKLADFGVSTISKKFKQGTFIGSPMWMAPEVIKCETDPKNRYSNKCDVWSLGVTVIEFGDGECITLFGLRLLRSFLGLLLVRCGAMVSSFRSRSGGALAPNYLPILQNLSVGSSLNSAC
jgi:serine/threonine protein kinase